MQCAHRVMYERVKGEIPKGLQLDHLCRNPGCINPDHLEPVTPKENTRRAMQSNGHYHQCERGHPYDEQNTLVVISSAGTNRKCRTCARIYRLRYKQKFLAAP